MLNNGNGEDSLAVFLYNENHAIVAWFKRG